MWPTGNTHRKVLSTGLWHQHDGAHSHVTAPIASTYRPITANNK